MAVPLMKFPVLVYILILDLMGLQERFWLSTTSKKAKQFVRQFLQKKEYEIKFSNYKSIGFHRIEDQHRISNNFKMYIKDENMGQNVNTCLFLEEEFRIEMYYDDYFQNDACLLYCNDKKSAFVTLINYFVYLLKTPKFLLSFRIQSQLLNNTLEEISKSFFVVRSVDLKVSKVSVKSTQTNRIDSFVQALLDKFKDTDEMELVGRIGQNFAYQPNTNEPFKFKSLIGSFNSHQVFEFFMNCEQIDIPRFYQDLDVQRIINRWSERCKLQLFQCWIVECSLTIILASVESTPVLKAAITDFDGRKVLQFKEGECSKISQEDGTEAIVFHRLNSFCLTTNFDLDVENEAMYESGSE